MKIFYYVRLLVALILLILGYSILSKNVFAQSSPFQKIEILKENDRTYRIKELIAPNNYKFEPYKQAGFSPTKQSYWLRFTYQKSPKQKSSYLSCVFVLYQNIDLYFQQGDSLHHNKNGVSLDFEERNIFSPNMYLELPNTVEPTVCLLHVTGFYNYTFFFDEIDAAQIIKNEVKFATLEYFFVGLICLATIFSLIFFIYLKSRLYLYYAVFCLMLLLLRLTLSGFIYNYITTFYNVSSLKSLLNLYAISYGGISIALTLYFYEYLNFYQRVRSYYIIIYSWVIVRLVFLIIHVNIDYTYINAIVDSRLVDLAMQIFLLITALVTDKKYRKPQVMAVLSLLVLITGNLQYILPSWGWISHEPSNLSLTNLAATEVILFAISIAYRSHFIKSERDIAISKMVENLRESDKLKDSINKELEIKVAERTQTIQEMNELLKSHNIVLKSEVISANEARAFQKNMNFEDFQKTFPTEDSCYDYLANLKWKPNQVIKCIKCGNEGCTRVDNHSVRCGKCRSVESATNSTLFHRLKFPIQKAFYITYLTSLDTKDSNNVAEISKNIDIRLATAWTFKQKVLALMESNRAKKKHKDGWTHLI